MKNDNTDNVFLFLEKPLIRGISIRVLHDVVTDAHIDKYWPLFYNFHRLLVTYFDKIVLIWWQIFFSLHTRKLAKFSWIIDRIDIFRMFLVPKMTPHFLLTYKRENFSICQQIPLETKNTELVFDTNPNWKHGVDYCLFCYFIHS